MRGSDDQNGSLFSYVNLDERIPSRHPLRKIREVVNAALIVLDADFDRLYVSGRMGVIKPDPRIYQMVEEDCGLPPASLLFTDDRADNITAAARRGWRTHQFESWQGWAARLVAEGLLTAKEAGL